ncbi:hypothetical protein DFH11DRAFT_1549720 [Phellopilus nigrolimitatus]|nr:hypothetical protein DFH11DRAFT_1549720 [Phellopilus nigrolimitatus]
MPFNVSGVPDDIWFEIALLSDLKEILALEALKQLRALDQDRAPNLPRHNSIDKLHWHEVRTLVVRAHQRRFNCTGSAPLQPTREITVPIGSANLNNKALREPYVFQTDVELLPGGRLLLVLWSEGYLQCWDVPGGESIWTYPNPASSGAHEQRVRGFCYEMQADNVVHIITKSLSQDLDRYKSSFEIFRISTETKEPKPLYKYPEQYPNIAFGMSFMKLCGDISAIYTNNNLFVTFWKERRTVQIEALPNVDATSTLVLDDLPYTKCPLPSQPYWMDLSAEMSTCDFHWKSEAERKLKGITITESQDVSVGGTDRQFFVINSFFLETTPGTASMSRCRPVKRFSQAGSTVAGYKEEHPDYTVFLWMLATISCGKGVVLRKLELPRVESVADRGLPYLNAVCRETLRVFPPATQVDRITKKDVVTTVVVSILGANRRNGFKFSEMELKLILSMLLEKFVFAPGPETKREMGASHSPVLKNSTDKSSQLLLKVTLVNSKR